MITFMCVWTVEPFPTLTRYTVSIANIIILSRSCIVNASFHEIKVLRSTHNGKQTVFEKKNPNRIPQNNIRTDDYDAIIPNRTLHTYTLHAHNTTLSGRVQQSSLNRHHNINRHYHTEQSRLSRYGVYIGWAQYYWCLQNGYLILRAIPHDERITRYP